MDDTNQKDDANPTEEHDATSPDGEAVASETDQNPADENPASEDGGVTPFDLTGSSGLSDPDAKALEDLHSGCAVELAQVLGGAVGADVGVELTSVAQQTYRDFRGELPTGTYIATNNLRPLGEDVSFCLDPQVALPLVDLLLGGPGDPQEIRDLTAIEARILENVIGLVSRALQAAWRPVLDQAFVWGRRVPDEETSSLMGPGEPALLLSFEIALQGVTGKLTIVLSPVASNALIRKLTSTTRGANRLDQSTVSDRLGNHILNTPFEVEVVLPRAPVPARHLIGLKVGDVLKLPHAIDQSAMIVVAGRPLLSGMPVRYEKSRAVEVMARLGSAASEQQRESA